MYTLITGASSGIGRALALECASRGMNILLVALPGDELMAMEHEIKTTYKVACSSLGIDLSQHCSSKAVYDWTKENNFRINILINNVGVGSKGAFENISPEFCYTQINLNITITCMLTRLFIEELKANKPARIMNVGSMGGFYCLPDKTLYSASKAFVYAFSRSLRLELEPHGIEVSVLCPGGTDSNHKTITINKDLKGLAKASILQPEQVAKEAIRKMLKGRPRIIPGKLNKMIYHVGRLIPEFIKNYFVSNAFKHVNEHKY